MNAEDQLIKSFYNGFWSLLAVSIVFLILIVFMILSKSKFLERYNNSKKSNIWFWIVITIMIIYTMYIIFQFIIFCKDKKQVDNRDFITITGTVVGFDKKTYYNDYGNPTYSDPIINIEGTNEAIILKLTNVHISGTYKIIYLKHTRLAKLSN